MDNQKIICKSFFLIVLLILPLVIGQPENQQEWNYNDDNSYRNPQFYENSDPNKWNRDKIDFNNDALHKRLNSDEQAREWYLRDYLGCKQCLFITGGQDIRYSPEGMIHPKSGLFKNPQIFPPWTEFEANSETIIVKLAQPNAKLVVKDPSILGSVKIDATQGNLFDKELISILHEGREIKLLGLISVSDGKLFISEGDNAVIEGFSISAKSTDVQLFFDGKKCQSPCLSIGKDEVFAKGKGFEFRPLGLYSNPGVLYEFFKVKDSPYDPKIIGTENDILKFQLGDLKDKEGEVKISKPQNAMPLVETDGFVRLVNDKIPLRCTDSHCEIELRTDIDPNSGSVPLSLIAGGNKKRIYQFDESQNLYADNEATYQSQLKLRKFIENNYNVKIVGYFSENELKMFEESLKKLESAYDIDIKKLITTDGKALSIADVDRRFSRTTAGAAYFEINNEIEWHVGDRQIQPESRIIYGGTTGGSEFGGNPNEAPAHEVHHVFFSLSTGYRTDVINKLKDIGFTIVGKEYVPGKTDMIIPKDSVPKELIDFLPSLFVFEGKVNNDIEVDELQAYISQEHLYHPDWFNDPKVSQEIREKRQKFREVYFQSMNKFKKDKNQ